jgi:hypothetical protein
MNIGEILRKLADVVDQQGDSEITNRPEQAEVEVEQPTDTPSIEGQAQVNVKSMTPPLQQKLDILKKLAGVPCEGCEECGCAPCECGDESWGGEGAPEVVDGADVNHPGAIEINGTMDAEGAQQLADQLAAKEQGQPDELETMKKMAGIFTAADNDIED